MQSDMHPNMQRTPRRRTSGGYRAPMEPPRRRKQKRVKLTLLGLCMLFIAVSVLIILVTPKEPMRQVRIGGGDGEAMESSYKGLVISEIMSSNKGSVPDETGDYPDWIEIWNHSGADLNIKDIGLSDESTAIRFLFPNVILPDDGRVVVYCSNTNRSVPGEALHAKFKLSSVGETVCMYDPKGYLLDSVTYPIMGSDEVYALQESGEWAVSKLVTPGYENTEEGALAYQHATRSVDGALIISEIMADALAGLRDEDGDLSDWIEIYNTTDQTIYLKNYCLSDKPNKPMLWRFPDDAIIAPHGYYVVFCSGKDRLTGGSGVPHTNFSISAEHEELVLSDSRGHMVDRVVIDNLPEDCSYARLEDGAFTVLQIATPGLPNTEAGQYQMDANLRRMNPTGVYISEVMASNDSVSLLSGERNCDWIEIYNAGSQIVDLSGYGLSDRLTRGRKWQFPSGTTIMPGQYLLLLCDGQSGTGPSGALHTSFKIRRTGGEIVCLADPSGRVLDKMVLPKIPANVSFGRTMGMAGFFYYDAPTPGVANGTGFLGYAETPSFTVEPGLHYATVYTRITVPAGTTVRYTVDGSDPTEASPVYRGEMIEMSFTTVIRARSWADADGIQPSDILTGTYFVNAYHSLPIVSLVTDPDHLWNPVNGILTAGPDVDKSKGIPFKNTIYRQVKDHGDPVACHIEYYLLDGTQVLDQGAEVSLQGQFSLDMPQKSFKLRAKSIYGAKTFGAALFDDREYEEYKSIVLRNSGNDCAWTRLLDGFQSRLLDASGSTLIHQAWNPVVVYLNGIYWGHYNMRERVDRFFIAQHEGLPLSEAYKMDIVEASGTAAYGSAKEYKAMIKKIKASSPEKNAADLQYILDNVDVDNYFEYIAYEMFFGNSDPGNIRYYRLQQPGSKWKWVIYDLDYGLYNSGFDSPTSYTKAKGMGDQKIDNTILLALLKVPEYKDKFLQKLGSIFQTMTTDFMLSVLEPLVELIEPEMNLHFTRWADEHDQKVMSEWPTRPDAAYNYWVKRIERLRNTCRKRPNYLWGYVRDAFSLTNAQMVSYFGERPRIPDDAV